MSNQTLPWDLQMELIKQQEQQALARAVARRNMTGSAMNPGNGKPAPIVKRGPDYRPSSMSDIPQNSGKGVFSKGPGGIVRGAGRIAGQLAKGAGAVGLGMAAVDTGISIADALQKAYDDEVAASKTLPSTNELDPSFPSDVETLVRGFGPAKPQADPVSALETYLRSLNSAPEQLTPLDVSGTYIPGAASRRTQTNTLAAFEDRPSAATPQAAAPAKVIPLSAFDNPQSPEPVGSSVRSKQQVSAPRGALNVPEDMRSDRSAVSSEAQMLPEYSPGTDEVDVSAFVPNDGPAQSSAPVESQQPTNDPYLDRMLALLENRQEPLQEELDPASVEVLNSLSKNTSEYEAPPETFGRKVKRFITAGSGPVDFTRMERQERALHQDKNALTDREKLRADVANRTITGAQTFNRNQRAANEASGGLSPQTKFALDLIGGDRQNSRAFQQSKDLATHQSNLRRKEMEVKTDPEATHAKFIMDTAERYPDLLPSVFSQMGIPLDQKALESIQQGRTGGSSVRDQLIVELVKQRMSNLQGKATKPVALNVEALR